ncbi:hypothetical protein BDV96DRAFT_684346 [Lophiotrema nucula]|uniref:USP domain-containing protein n=1 Tax=Lophiotrema nucula TaxID=690887 RepID=A0A6A5ZGQ2_9PLEO|nr:hypothetical protein BDV96DRAFT_684346 [Lophiotrema nucula]
MAPITRRNARVSGIPLHGPLPPATRLAVAPAPLPTSIGGLPIAAPIVAQKARRDNAATRLARSWRFRLESRGIVRLKSYNTCYQNSVQQAFMHQPPFLEWILTHNSHAREAERRFGGQRFSNGRVRRAVKSQYRKRNGKKNEDGEEKDDLGPILNPCKRNGKGCFACEMKGLAIRYWDKANPPQNPIQFANEVKRLAMLTWGRPDFPNRGQADANAFYDFCIDQMRACAPLTAAAAQAWRDECSALYDILYSCTYTCTVCNTSRRPHGSPYDGGTNLHINVEDNSGQAVPDIPAALDRYFHGDDVQVYCNTCNSTTRNRDTKELFIAPIILRLNVLIFTSWDEECEGMTKSDHATPSIPELLDLRRYQVDQSQPLRYRLSSVIAHVGQTTNSGHYVSATRGPLINMRLDDDHRRQISPAQLMGNPHAGRYACYELTYIRG